MDVAGCKHCSMDEDSPSIVRRIFAAVFYGVSSFMIIVANKIVLTSYKYVNYVTLLLCCTQLGFFVLSTSHFTIHYFCYISNSKPAALSSDLGQQKGTFYLRNHYFRTFSLILFRCPRDVPIEN